MKQLFITIFSLVLLSNSLFAELGNGYATFWKSDFSNHFKLTEQKIVSLKYGIKKIKLAPEAYQDFIEINLFVDSLNTVLKSEIYIKRIWLTSNLPLAEDIIKSFLNEMVISDDLKKASPLIENISTGSIDINTEGIDALEVFTGEKDLHIEKYTKSFIYLKNCRFYDGDFFLAQVGKIEDFAKIPHEEQALNPEIFYLNDLDLKDYNLKLVEFDDDRTIWKSEIQNKTLSHLTENIVFVENDLKATKQLAQLMESKPEGTNEISPIPIKFNESIRIFKKKTDLSLNEAIGFELNVYYIYFSFKKTIVKLSLTGNKDLTLEKVLEIAKQAQIKISNNM